MGVGLKKLCPGWGRSQNIARGARGGAGTLAERAGGGARKFCLSLKWVQIVGPDLRGRREGGGGAKKLWVAGGGTRVLAGNAGGGARKFCRSQGRGRSVGAEAGAGGRTSAGAPGGGAIV